MSQCNLDFFDAQLNYIHHDSTETPVIDLDYLTPEASTFDIGQTNAIATKNLVRIEEHDNYLAVVDSVNQKEGYTTVSIKPFISTFDQSVLFDTNWQYKAATSEVPNPDNSSAKSLEVTIADLITQYWINSTDTPQNMPLQLYTTSTTTNWSFGLVGDRADDDRATSSNNHQCVVEFYDVILQNALMRYRVALDTVFDVKNRVIKIYIGVSNQTKYIEADLDEAEVIDFSIGKLESDTNKLEIWNSENYSDKIYYFLHTDGTYNTDGTTARIKPIKMDVITAAPERDSNNTITKTFAEVCKELADQEFGDLKWRNYIEIDTGRVNVYKAESMKIGQLANVIYQGKTYETILTGIKFGEELTLIFGTIRVDLTKKLQLESSLEYTDAKSVTKNSSTSSN